MKIKLRFGTRLSFTNNMLMINYRDRMVPVVPFRFMLDVVYKVHNELAHIGRHKIFEMIIDKFWHPALDSIARDVCASCTHCQLFKISTQPVSPPTLKLRLDIHLTCWPWICLHSRSLETGSVRA